MGTVIEGLSSLYEEEEQHNSEARELRKKQLKLCKKELLGKCFRIKDRRDITIKGEEYRTYVCFTDIAREQNWNGNFYLLAIVVDFDDVTKTEDWGVQICYQSHNVGNWLDLIEDAEETTVEEFNEAKRRAIDFLDEKAEKVAEEE